MLKDYTAMASVPPATRQMVRIEALTEDRFKGAVGIQNDFLGARKRACGVCSYACCPTTVFEFAIPYKMHPDKLSTSAVAVSETDGSVVGFVQMTQHGMPRDPFSAVLHAMKPGECYIEMMGVSAAARGQGVGTRLLNWSEEQARARGASVLSLGVVNGNPAQRLYERFGFVAKPKGACSTACTGAVTFCLFGMPHGRCGAVEMEKPLTT